MRRHIHIHVARARRARDAGRIVHTVTSGAATVKVYWDAALKEYTCTLFVNGVKNVNADYFTDSLEDAKNSAKDMAQRADKSKPKDAQVRIPVEYSRLVQELSEKAKKAGVNPRYIKTVAQVSMDLYDQNDAVNAGPEIHARNKGITERMFAELIRNKK